MTEDDSTLVEQTARAMRELASTVTEAPPPRLAPSRRARGQRRPPWRFPRRGWTRWAVPLAAAVAVIAVALALVAIRDWPNGRGPHPVRPARPSAAPAYYVAPEAVCAKKCDPTRLVVGNTYTGARLATLTPPPGTTFGTVSAAADDRTFVTDTVRYPVDFTTSRPQHVTWYRLTIAPGSPAAVRLTRLPVPALPAAAKLTMVALSASGQQLAMLYHLGSDASGRTVLATYSVPSGKPLRSWSTGRRVMFGQVEFLAGEQTNNELSWADGDRALTFPASPFTLDKHGGLDSTGATVRVLSVTASGHDLMADSRAVWPRPKAPRAKVGSKPGCDDRTALFPLLAANGTTLICTDDSPTLVGSGQNAPTRWLLTWLTAPVADLTATRVAYQVTSLSPANDSGPSAEVLWASASGSTLIVAWAPGVSNQGNRVPPVIHYGVVRRGTFTPLPAVPDEANLIYESPGIVW